MGNTGSRQSGHSILREQESRDAESRAAQSLLWPSTVSKARREAAVLHAAARPSLSPLVHAPPPSVVHGEIWIL